MNLLLSDVFDSKAIVVNLSSTEKKNVFAELVDAMALAHPECDQSEILAALWERENKMSTGIAPSIAIPHAIYRGISTIIGAIGISKSGIDYDALDNNPVHVVFLLAMGEFVQENHMQVLNKIFTLVQAEAFQMIKNAKTAQDVYDILCQMH